MPAVVESGVNRGTDSLGSSPVSRHIGLARWLEARRELAKGIAYELSMAGTEFRNPAF